MPREIVITEIFLPDRQAMQDALEWVLRKSRRRAGDDGGETQDQQGGAA